MSRWPALLLGLALGVAGCREQVAPRPTSLIHAAYVWRQGWDPVAVASLADRTWPAGLTELNGVKNSVFKKGTEGLVAVNGGAEAYFGTALAKYSGLDRLSEVAAAGEGGASASSSPAPAGWISPGAAAGLGIGAGALGALLGGGATWLVGKRCRRAGAAANGGFDSYAAKGFVPSA